MQCGPGRRCATALVAQRLAHRVAAYIEHNRDGRLYSGGASQPPLVLALGGRYSCDGWAVFELLIVLVSWAPHALHWTYALT